MQELTELSSLGFEAFETVLTGLLVRPTLHADLVASVMISCHELSQDFERHAGLGHELK